MFWFRRSDRANDLSARMKRAREEAYLRGSREAMMFKLATRGAYQRQQMFEWLDTVIDDGRAELEAQHALEREIEAWDMSCRIMFLVTLT
jgi:hypothetical protein